jgi:hypothetical protein
MCKFKNDQVLDKLYDRIDDKIADDLNIVQLIKRVRDAKILQNQQMNALLRFKIDHSHKNIINLNSSEESFNSSVGSDFFNEVIDKDKDKMSEAERFLAMRNFDSLKAGSGEGLAPRIVYDGEI